MFQRRWRLVPAGSAGPQMVGAALQRAQRVVVVVAEERGAGEHAHLRHGGEALRRLRRPGRAVHAVDAVAEAEQRAAERRLLVHEQDPGAGLAGGERGADPRRAAAHHQHVAVNVHLVVGVGVGRLGRAAEARHAPDHGLVERLPERRRPEEGLVVEAGGEERRELPGPGGEIAVGARPGVDAGGGEPVVELDLGRAQVGLGARAFAELDQRGRLLRAGGEDAARPVVLEAPAREVRAVRDQRRRQRVPGEALVAPPVEGEAQALRPVDPPAVLETKAHYSPSASPPGASGRGRAHGIDREHVVAHGVAQRVEPAPAALPVHPALGMDALGVGAHEEVVGPARHRRSWPGRGARCGPRRRSGTRSRAGRPHQGQSIQSIPSGLLVRHGRRRVLVDQRARGEAVEREGALSGCGSPVAMVWASTQPEPGVALKPPVPQPPLMKRPSHGRLADDGRGVGADIHDPGPGAHHAHPAEDRDQLAPSPPSGPRWCAGRPFWL